MNIQNVLKTNDSRICPVGKGEIIDNYLRSLYGRVSEEVASAQDYVDWLVIKSDDLFNLARCNQNFFEGMLEESLRETLTKDISVIKFHARASAGYIPKDSIYGWVKEKLGHNNFKINNLNNLDLGNSFVLYHLDMRNSETIPSSH